MLIYSLAPIDLQPAEPAAPTVLHRFAGGCCEGVDTPQGFVVQRIISTDPAAYLSGRYYPGAILPRGTRH